MIFSYLYTTYQIIPYLRTVKPINNTDMETTKKTKLEAFIEAQKTGQIAIRPKTARILEHMMRLEEIVGTLYDDFSDGYPSDAQDEIYNRIYNAYTPIHEEVLNEFKDYLVMESLGCVEFGGL